MRQSSKANHKTNMMRGRPCTCCSAPALVDLTDAFFLDDKDELSSSPSSSLKDGSTTEKLLKANLTKFGWSNVRIRLPPLSLSSSSSSTTSSLSTPPFLCKEKLISFFDHPDVSSNNIAGVTHRFAESGAPGTVEPKQSLEVQRQRRRHSVSWTGNDNDEKGNHKNENKDKMMIRTELLGFADLLHNVACAVRRCLQMPANVILDERVFEEEEEEQEEKSQAQQQQQKRRLPPPLDLLRVFYYDTVKDEEEKGSSSSSSLSTSSSRITKATMGSNEHTDWGSFTVVWQDDVGGLQTYCHACDQWVEVAPTTTTTTTTTTITSETDQGHVMDFVVHVGDLTSICMGLALTVAVKPDKVTAEKNDHDDDNVTVVWPSPKHRVVSPKEQKRLSLVYFAYPPSSTSLQTMQQDLTEWCRRCCGDHDDDDDDAKCSPSPSSSSSSLPSPHVQVPWSDYYILRNQSNQEKQDDPLEMYKKIAPLPIDKALQEKWKQVQR